MSLGIHNAKKSKVLTNKNFGSIYDAIDEETEIFRLTASQIFTHGPRNTHRNAADYGAIKKMCSERNIELFVHGSYPSISVWSSDRTKRKKMMTHIIDMMLSCVEMGSRGLVLHLPKKAPDVVLLSLTELEHAIKAHKKYKELDTVHILLEMPAMRPADGITYETPEKLNNLCAALEHLGLHWGLCIDTAHLWSGAVSLSKDVEWCGWFEELTPETNARIKLIHLNGSIEEYFGVGRDIHMIPFSDKDAIWGRYISNDLRQYLDDIETPGEFDGTDIAAAELAHIKHSGLFNLLLSAKRNSIPIICEINRGGERDAKNYIRLIRILLDDAQ